MVCPSCEKDIEVEVSFDNIYKPFPCPHCETMIELCYEETYDAETYEEDGWFYLEKVEKSKTL